MNGEILGVSLLLEDVLQSGLPDVFFSKQEEDSSSATSASPRSRPHTGSSRRPQSRHSNASDTSQNEEGSQEGVSHFDIPKGPISITKNPKAAVKLVNMFLLICARLELLKTDWSCRKLATNEVTTTKQYRKFWYVRYHYIYLNGPFFTVFNISFPEYFLPTIRSEH